MLYATVKPVCRGALRLLFGFTAEGAEHVPDAGPVLIAANHSSLLDPLLVGVATRRELTFLTKAELLAVPLFGGFIRRLNARPLRREGSDPAALRLALRVLEEGGALLVFPEGTRGEEGRLRPAKPGAGMLAALSGAAVVPAYISGSGRAWPRGRRLPRPGKIAVSFGPALRMERGQGPERKERYEAASRAMMAAIARLSERAVGAPPGAAPAYEIGAVGGAGTGTGQHPPKYFDGRNRRHGEG